MRVGTFNDEGDGFRGFDIFHVSILSLAEGLLVDQTSPAENLGAEVINTILCGPSTDKLKSELVRFERYIPLHVASFYTSQGEYTIFDEDIEGQWINALLIEDNKALLWIGTADLVFEFDNLSEL